MPNRIHCCSCGREWVPDAHWPHNDACPRCHSRSVRTVADCLDCQADAVQRGVPRERWLCEPHEGECHSREPVSAAGE